MNEEVIKNMNRMDEGLSSFACHNKDAFRFKEEENDYRPPFFRDIDRVIYSDSYARYMDKTQVFSFMEHDHISRRMTHVQLVSKIARNIGRALRLNEDLIEAAALGHDLGHVPFGHPGEEILSRISQENNEGFYNHNIQSVRLMMYLEENGKGRNLTLQVLDAIMCHNGEFLMEEYHPVSKTKEEFLKEYELSYKKSNITKTFIPMTLEGCVVRISDIIAYVGKDIEDAITLGVLKKKDLPENIRKLLGSSNKEIITNILSDLINNSVGKPYLKMSKHIYEALKYLKDYNYKNIYSKANKKSDLELYEKMFRTLFEHYLESLKEKNKKCSIYKVYLDNMIDEYKLNTPNERIVIDYLAGMTDDFIYNEYLKISEQKN